MTKPAPLTMQTIIGIIPALVLFAGIVGSYTLQKAQITDMQTDIDQILQDNRDAISTLNKHEVRISLLEARKSSSVSKPVTVATASPWPITIQSEVTVKEESAEPKPAPSPKSELPRNEDPPRVLPSPLELVERILK